MEMKKNNNSTVKNLIIKKNRSNVFSINMSVKKIIYRKALSFSYSREVN